MAGDSDVLRNHRVDVLAPFLTRRQFVPSSHAQGTRSAIDLPLRLPALLRAWDWLGIVAIGVLIDFVLTRHDAARASHSLYTVLGATLTVNYMQLAQGYRVRDVRRKALQSLKTSLAWMAAFASLVTIGYIVDRSQELQEPWAGMWLASEWLFLVATRWAVAPLIASWQKAGRLTPNIAVLGTGQEAITLARRLQARTGESRVVGVFVDGVAPNAAADIDGDSDCLASLIASGQVDEVVLTSPFRSSDALHRILAKFAASQVEVKIDAGLSELDVPMLGYSPVAGIPTVTVQTRPLAGWGAPLKRAEDILLSGLALALVAPVFLLIAVLIKLDSPGPVFFRQERTGFSNRRMLVYKFRTMYHDPNPDPGVPQAQRNDPRITRIGAFLRRTSLDELPQLLNVLRGDMSLVGPRPHATAHNEKYARLIDGFLARHRMKPGITGWAQVNGWRGETDTIEKMQGRLACDLYYITNWSLLLDIKVLLMTFPAVIRGTNAW